MNIPEGILCTRTHSWALEEEKEVLVGLTDWQASNMGDIVSFDLPEDGMYLKKDEPFATLESIRMAYELYMPVSGKIIEVNEQLINSPELINEDCYKNWIIKIEPDNFPEDSQDLIEYVDYIDELS